MNIPTFYQLLVFLHVLGAVGMFVALGIEAVALERLGQARTPAGVRLSMGLLAVPRRLGPPAMLVTLFAGIWMMAVLWGSQPWIHAAFAGLAVIGVLGGVVTRRGLSRVGQALQAEIGSELSPELRALQSSAGLLASLRMRVAIGIGILGLMTLKPDAAGSWILLGAAIVAGLVGGWHAGRRRTRDERDTSFQSRSAGTRPASPSGVELQSGRV